jgi:hypothetical protein
MFLINYFIYLVCSADCIVLSGVMTRKRTYLYLETGWVVSCVKKLFGSRMSALTFFYAIWLSLISGAQWLQIPSRCRLLILLFFHGSCFACGCDKKNFPVHSYSVQQMMAALCSKSGQRKQFCLLSWLVYVTKTCLLPAVQWDCWLAWEHLQWDSTYYSQHLWCRPSRGPWHSETSSASECMR